MYYFFVWGEFGCPLHWFPIIQWKYAKQGDCLLLQVQDLWGEKQALHDKEPEIATSFLDTMKKTLFWFWVHFSRQLLVWAC